MSSTIYAWMPAQRAQGSRSPEGLRRCLEQAEYRVLDAKRIPWPALAESWQRDVDQIKALIAARGEGA